MRLQKINQLIRVIQYIKHSDRRLVIDRFCSLGIAASLALSLLT